MLASILSLRYILTLKLHKLLMNICHISLHLFKFVYNNAVVYQQQLQAVETFIQSSKFLVRPVEKAFAHSLVTNQLGPMSLHPQAPESHCVLVELTVHLAAVLLCGNQGILGPLHQLAFAPANMQVCVMSCFSSVMPTR